MIVQPNAKLNLGLFVTGRRPDGYHTLETAFLPIALCDRLELELAPDLGADSLEVTGAVDTGRLEDNLVLRAVAALRSRYSIPSLRLRLEKHIPSGAGMGGGSADASFTLTALRSLCALPASDEELEDLALQLGADCPVFVRNRPALAYGIGEELHPLELPQLSGLWLTVVKPELHVATAEAFRGLGALQAKGYSLRSVLERPVAEWRELLVNDFEASLFPKYPELARLKELLYSAGASFALLTGSGAALYALSSEPLTLASEVLRGCFHWQTQL